MSGKEVEERTGAASSYLMLVRDASTVGTATCVGWEKRAKRGSVGVCVAIYLPALSKLRSVT